MVGTDNATLNRSRATGARICVEIDLTVEAVKGFPIVVSPTKCIWQDARYEKQGFYCTKCYRQGHTTVVCRVGERRKEVRKPKENITWQPKKFDINGSSLGTKDDKEMEANMASLSERLQVTREDKNSNVVQLESLEAAPNSINAGMISNIEGESAEMNQSGYVPSFLLNTEMLKDPLQDLVHILENEKDVSEEECDEVCSDKENEVA
ncbi:hypothetical protein ACLOJK_019405 [Asimina triloba]